MKKGWVYVDEEGNTVYRASSLGGCLVGLTASRLGIDVAPRPKPIQDAMDQSQAFEATTLELAGNVAQRQKEVWLLVNEGEEPPIFVCGHIDGMQNGVVVDAKNVSKKQFEAFDKRGISAFGPLGEQYLWQISCYMHALGAPGKFIVGRKREDGTGIDALLEEEYDVPPISLDDIRKRIMTVEEAARTETWPACDRACTSWSPYWEVHEQPDIFVLEEGAQSDAQLIELLTYYRSTKDLAEELTATAETIRKKIIEHVQPGIYLGGGVKGILKEVPGAERFDSTAFKKANPDLHKEFTVVGKSYHRLVVEWTDEGSEDATGTTRPVS